VLLFLASLVIVGFILYEQGVLDGVTNGFSGDNRVFGSKDKEGGINNNDDTQSRIEQLEGKIKQLEDDRMVPFPEKKASLLTEEQIGAIVELWCPDDYYGFGSSFVSIGSGIIVGPDGLIITNRHVVSNEDWSVINALPTCFVAVTEDITEEPVIKYTANIIAYAPEPSASGNFDFDVAILRINDVCHDCEYAPANLPSEFPYLTTGYSSGMDIGNYIAIAGYPEIGSGTFNFTEGIVSGRVGEFVLKTDAKIDSGNSGGAALNSQHQLVGVPTWTISGSAESMGYIIGIDQVFSWYNNKVTSATSVKVPY